MSTQLLLDNQDKVAFVKLSAIFRNICLCMHFPFFSKFRPLTIYRTSGDILVFEYDVDA